MPVSTLIGIIGGLVIAIGIAIPSIITAIKNGKEAIKNKNWLTIMAIVNDAVKIAEATEESGPEKKARVIAAVTKTCADLAIEVDVERVSSYIDELIGWFNGMNKKEK